MWRFICRLSSSVLLLALLFFACLFVFENPQNTNLVFLGTTTTVPVWLLLFVSLAVGFFSALLLTQGKVMQLQASLWWKNKKN